MRSTMRASIALGAFALLIAACGGGAPDATQDDLGVAHCRPFARCGLTGPDQYCADLSSDEENCGACGHACAAGEVCLGGSCAMPCADGLVSCRDADPAYCTDVTTSEANCGGCGLTCAGDQFCDNGVCRPACPDPALPTNCGTPDARVCADLQTDGQNCGSCGRACPPGYACTEGGCTLICLAPTSYCPDVGQGEYCADFLTSAANCGACGNVCANGFSCSNGACVPICDAPLEACGSTCVNTQTDAQNCGACGSACATGWSCEAGACVLQCAAGELHCGTGPDQYCTSPNDASNCGACGNVCSRDQNCTDGACVCNAPLSNCGTACVDLAADASNCGACGNVCTTFEPVCLEGVCAADPAATSYAAAVTFTDALGRAYPSLTFQGGAGYWSASGDATATGSVVNVASYDPAFGTTGKYTTSYNWRTVFTAGGNGGTVYARYRASSYVMRMMSPGVFQSLVQIGAPLYADGSIAMSADGTELLTLYGGYVYVSNTLGGTLKTKFPLVGFGTLASENVAPQNGRLAVAGDKVLTYANGTLSVWDRLGARLRSVQLEGAGTTTASHVSLSYANGYVWIVDGPGGTWRGYRVGGL